VETREMGVQYEDGGGQVTLINAQLLPFEKYPIVDTLNTVKSSPNVCIYFLQTLMRLCQGVIVSP